jgi:Uma2 family endonuclease
MAGGSLERPAHKYLREPVPIFFPVAEQLPESSVHLRVRTALYLLLERELRGKAFVGSDQFVYWNPTDPKQCLAPDVMVRLGMPSTPLPSFKTWKHGAPHVAVEIVSPSDSRDDDWNDKLERYRRCGVAELVRVNPESEAPSLTLWDLVEGDLVERDLAGGGSRWSPALGAYWVLIPDTELRCILRLARDPEGTDLWPTTEELLARERAEKEAARAEKEAARAEKELASAEKEAALARIAELERQLRERKS